MSTEIVKGSCHCGAVTFSANIDFGEPTIRCNCSICTKSRTWIATTPAADFDLLSDEGPITEYRFGGQNITHCFCSRCGIKTHGRVRGADGSDELIAVSVAALDLAPEHLAAIRTTYVDGRNDRFEEPPKVVAYL